jgi:hypothetical protein
MEYFVGLQTNIHLVTKSFFKKRAEKKASVIISTLTTFALVFQTN